MSRNAEQPDRDAGAAPTWEMPRGLRRLVLLARAAVAWEHLWPRLWPAAGVAALFLAFALLDLPALLGGWLHLLVLVAFAVGFGVALWRGVSHLAWPGGEAGRRRLEHDSELRHRPLTGLEDSLAAGANDPAAAALWAAHRRRLEGLLGRLRVRWPRPDVAQADPRALRAIPVLLLAAGLIVGGHAVPERLERAVTPAVLAAAAPPPQVDVWLDPPSYTGQAPRFLKTEGPEAPKVLTAPAGSRVLAQVQGGGAPPTLQAGSEEISFEQVAQGAWKAEATLGKPGAAPSEAAPGDAAPALAVVQDETTLVRWPLDIRPDHAPRIDFPAPPQRGERNALHVTYKASDDYGLESVRLRITREGDARIEPIVRELPLPEAGAREAESGSYHDLTAHVWAGLEVQVRLIAEDAIGQTGESEAVTTVLPERTFQHPVARRLVELRKQLTRKPQDRLPIVQGLADLQRRPHHFYGDVVVALSLRAAERRLIYDKGEGGIAEVQELMWRTALRIEEGELAVAERDLRRAQEELMEALSRDDVSEAELQRLMDQLEQAMNRFLEALKEQMRQQLAEGQEPQPLPPDAQLLESRDLQEMLQRMREMAQSGARDAARQMLSQLQNILENLRMNPMTGRMSEQGRQAMQMMRDLQNLTREQQRLLDETFRRSQQQQGMRGEDGLPQWQRQQQGRQGQQGQRGRQGQRPQQPGPQQPSMSPAERQEALRRGLGQLMRQLGNMMGQIPRPLGEAEQEMRGATRALENEQPGQAVQPQTNALDSLRQGMQAMQQALQQQMMGQQPRMGGQGQGPLGWQGDQLRDPLGRSREQPGQGHVDTGDVKIPSEAELQRAREILDELRRRSGQRNRPELELDYIERLLERF